LYPYDSTRGLARHKIHAVAARSVLIHSSGVATVTIENEIARRGPGRAHSKTMAGAVLAGLEGRLSIVRPRAADALIWPSSRFSADPVGFAHTILGIAPHAAQIEIARAVASDPKSRTAIASGHKIGKSLLLAWLALWFYCSFPRARAVMSSTTSRQVDQILWRELSLMFYDSGWCLDCKRSEPDYRRKIARPCPHSAVIDGDLHELARSGLKAPRDGREVVGFTAREAEAVAGISGANLMYLVDEASGVPDLIFEAIEGNRAGGARIVLTSNPTRTEGVFYECFDQKKEFWKTFQISSESVARLGIPGLAGDEWIAEKRREYGVDSPFYKIRVLGQFVQGEDGKVLTLHAIAQAEVRWQEVKSSGRLIVGLDPAGPGTAGDESVWAPRRGPRVTTLLARRGLSTDAHVVETLGLLREQRMPQDSDPNMCPLVVVDREGPIGAQVYAALNAYADAHPGTLEVLGVRSSDRASRQPFIYDRVRDELWGNLAAWLKVGAIPEDVKLAKELHCPEFATQIHGRLKVTEKSEMRKRLGRSPDRADALCLSVWVDDGFQAEARAPQAEDETLDWAQASGDADKIFDPYRGQ
jgi:phage terminase large subunit